MSHNTAEPAQRGAARVPEDCHAGRRDGSSNTLPIVIAQWPKSVRETLRVTLDEFNGRSVIDIRTWWWTEAGELRPGRAGLTVSTRHLKALATALSDAAQTAEERGLIDQGTER
jgi:hypothetical protein